MGRPPLSDAQAAAPIVDARTPEIRPGNAAANAYVPTTGELNTFHAALNQYGALADGAVVTRRQVTGRSGLSLPSTDDLIQWASLKWGIPTDVMRAQMVVESWWRQWNLGDLTTVSAEWYEQYPPQARITGAGANEVCQSMGISQIRWRPDGSVSPGTEPLRWRSTAFALDYLGARTRWFYDGLCDWGLTNYTAGQDWLSIGAWYEPYPWQNQGQLDYITKVKTELAARTWATSTFLNA